MHAFRDGGCSLDRNVSASGEGNQDAGESWQQGLNSNPAVCWRGVLQYLEYLVSFPDGFPRGIISRHHHSFGAPRLERALAATAGDPRHVVVKGARRRSGAVPGRILAGSRWHADALRCSRLRSKLDNTRATDALGGRARKTGHRRILRRSRRCWRGRPHTRSSHGMGDVSSRARHRRIGSAPLRAGCAKALLEKQHPVRQDIVGEGARYRADLCIYTITSAASRCLE